jgi:hypothetical protein
MLYREIIAVCSEIHTKHVNTLCGQNVELNNKNENFMIQKKCTYHVQIISISVSDLGTLPYNCSRWAKRQLIVGHSFSFAVP